MVMSKINHVRTRRKREKKAQLHQVYNVDSRTGYDSRTRYGSRTGLVRDVKCQWDTRNSIFVLFVKDSFLTNKQDVKRFEW